VRKINLAGLWGEGEEDEWFDINACPEPMGTGLPESEGDGLNCKNLNLRGGSKPCG